MLAGDAQSLGEYVVAQESSVGKGSGDLCPTASDYDGLHCGDKVWAYQTSAGEMILISEITKDNLETDELYVWAIEGKGCSGYSDVSSALSKGIAHLGLCSLSKAGDDNQLTATRPVTGGDVLWDVTFGITGIIAGSHTTNVAITDSSQNSFMVNDIYKTLRINDTMLLNRVSK